MSKTIFAIVLTDDGNSCMYTTPHQIRLYDPQSPTEEFFDLQ
jgi:hypothetical protein